MNTIILYQIEKPANLGNIIRTCVSTDTKLVVIGPLTYSIEDKELKRAGMDYINMIDFKYYNSYDDFLKDFKDKIIYYVTRYSKNVYSNNDYSDQLNDYCFMFGKESTGIPRELLKEKFDYTIRIPMVPSARSLNVSNCVSLVLYEALRQQKFKNLSTKEEIKGEDFIKDNY